MLKPRLADMNKVVQSLALDVVARIATGMNKPFEKYSRVLVLPVAQVMADQKANIRAAGATTLTAIAVACEGIDSMAHYLGTALEGTNPLLRSNLLGWMVGWLGENKPSPSTDLRDWSAPLVSCLEDRSAEVRKGAQAVLPYVIAQVGLDQVLNQTNALKPANRSAVIPLINAAAAAAGPKTSNSASTINTSSSSSTIKSAQNGSIPTVDSSNSVPGVARKGLLSKKLGVATPRPASRGEEDRPASPGGPLSAIRAKAFGLKRPASAAASQTPSPQLQEESMPFIGENSDPKRSRLAKDAGRWIIESGPSRKDLTDLLQHQMEQHASRELIAQLFSRDHNAINDFVSGLSTICDSYLAVAAGNPPPGVPTSVAKDILVANADLPLKYVSIKVHEPQPNLINKCLDVVDSILALFASSSYVLSDPEAACFVPTIIHKVCYSVVVGVSSSTYIPV